MSRAKKIWLVVGVAVVLALAAAVWLGRPAYRRYKENHSLAQARAFLARGDYPSAVLSLRMALTVNSASVEASRMMADLADAAQSPDALVWRRRVVELAPTIENKILFAASALRIEKPPFALATQTLEAIRPLAETNTAYHLVASQLALKLNRRADAEAHFEAAARLEPTNRLHQLNLATIRLQSAGTNAAAAARRELAGLASDPVLGKPALRSLIADSVTREQFAEAENFCRQLLAQPQVAFEDRLLRLLVLSKAKSADLAPALAQAQQEAATNTVKIAQTVSFMGEQGLAKEAFGWLNSLPAATRNAQPLPIVEADCYLILRDWPGLESRLREQRWEDREFLRLALLARALREQHRDEIGNAVWGRAAGAAAARNEYLVLLAQVAGSWGWQNETEELLWTIVKRLPAEEWALQNLLKRYGARNDTAGLYRVFQAQLERHPQLLEVKNNVAMLGLLLNRDVARAGELAREVYEADKTNAICVSTYAFALHTQTNTAGGLKLMQTLPESELQRPSIAAYYAILLAAAGEREKARPFFAAAEKAQLLPEERRLLAQALGQN